MATVWVPQTSMILVPANDGGVSLGQAALAAMKYSKEK